MKKNYIVVTGGAGFIGSNLFPTKLDFIKGSRAISEGIYEDEKPEKKE